jgi:hypothetical protein
MMTRTVNRAEKKKKKNETLCDVVFFSRQHLHTYFSRIKESKEEVSKFVSYYFSFSCQVSD